MNPLELLASLPALLGVTGFVIYYLLRRGHVGDPVTLKIIERLRREWPDRLSTAGGRLSPVHLARLIEQDATLREAISEQDFKLLHTALRQQFLRSVVVYVLCGVLFLSGVALYVSLRFAADRRPTLTSDGSGATAAIERATMAIVEDKESPHISLVKAGIELWMTSSPGSGSGAAGEAKPFVEPYLTIYLANQSRSSIFLTSYHVIKGTSLPVPVPRFFRVRKLRIPAGTVQRIPIARLTALVDSGVLARIVAAGSEGDLPHSYCPFANHFTVNGRCISEPIHRGMSLGYGLSLTVESVLGQQMKVLLPVWLYEKLS